MKNLRYHEKSHHHTVSSSKSKGNKGNDIEGFTCWICQEELSSALLLLEHYDDHMKYVEV